MECKKYKSRLEEWLDGELSKEDRAGFERHLRICSDCARYLNERRCLGLALKTAMNERTAGLHFQPPPLSMLHVVGREPKPRIRIAPRMLMALAAMVLVAMLILFHPWAAPRHRTVVDTATTAEITVSNSLSAGEESFISGRIDGFTYIIHLQVSAVKIDDHV